MASLSIINKVKYSPCLYTIYYYLGSMAVKLLGHFMREDPKLIVFSSFGGRKYDDSPKEIYEAMINDSRFDGYKLVWAFNNPENFDLFSKEKVKVDTLSYYKTLLKARVWVTNSSMTRGLNFTGKNTFKLNTWHGTPIKRMGRDINDGNTSFSSKGKSKDDGIMLAQGDYDIEVFSRAFQMSKECFAKIGLPRNDKLAHSTKEQNESLKKKLGIPLNKKVILYAPTFREYNKDSGNNIVLSMPINLIEWQKRLGDNYVLLFRAHYEVARVMGIVDNEFVKEVSSYPNLDDLMLASDILISDYSSIFFDYAIQGKPMFCYAYDYDEYTKNRGLYFDIRKELPSANDEESLLKLIEQIDLKKASECAQIFQIRYVTEFGDATMKALDIIYKNL